MSTVTSSEKAARRVDHPARAGIARNRVQKRRKSLALSSKVLVLIITKTIVAFGDLFEHLLSLQRHSSLVL
jgi:Cdc6-like AAA superfamily ATPase